MNWKRVIGSIFTTRAVQNILSTIL